MTARMTGGGKIRNWRMIQWTCCVGDTRSSIRRWKCEGLKLRSLNTFHKESVSQVGNPDLFSWDHWFLMRNYTRHTWIFRRPWYLKRLWSWEGSGLGGKGDDRGWDGWMASPTQWTWVWVNSRSWWWTRRPRVLRFMGSQRVDRTDRLNWTELVFDLGFPCGSAGKESTCNAGDLGSIPGLGRSSEERKGYPLQYRGGWLSKF